MLEKIRTVDGEWLKVIKEAWDEIFSNDLYTWQFVIGIVGIAVSLILGLALYDDIGLPSLGLLNPQLIIWGVCVVGVTALLLISKNRPKSLPLKGWQWMIGIVLIAFALRYIAVDTIPGLLHIDEVGLSDFALRHVFSDPEKTINPFRTGQSSMPTMFFYIIRAFYSIFGYSITSLRLPSVLAGTLAVFMVYLMVSELQSPRAGIFAAALMAGFHFHIHWSRLSLNNIWDTVWVPMILACYAYGWRKKWSGGAVLSGFALGISQYFYPGARLGIFLLGFLMVWLYRRDKDKRALLIFTGKIVFVAATIALPLFIFAIMNQEEFFRRTKEIFGWTEGYMIIKIGILDYWKFFKYQLLRSLGAFFIYSDLTGFYEPRVPFLFGLSPVLFMMGLIWSIIKKYWLPVVWIILTTIFAGMLIGDVPSSSHYVVSIPAMVWLIAIPLEWLSTQNDKKLFVLSIGILGLLLLTDLYFYFFIYMDNNMADLIHNLTPCLEYPPRLVPGC